MEYKKFFEVFGKDEKEIKWCIDYSKKYKEKELKHALKVAQEVCENRFIFDLAWDMEQTSEEVAFGEKIDWTYVLNNDVEFIFQLNRHRYWICLGQAYVVTRDEKYAKVFENQLLDWIRNNPINNLTKKTTWRTIEAGIRGENWIKAMSYFKNSSSISKQTKQMFFDSLKVHANYLLKEPNTFSEKSNWGIIEAHGLYIIGKALICIGYQNSYSKIALKRLKEQFEVQVLDDGVHWEQSQMYHNEVLKCGLEVLRVAKLFDEDVPKSLYEKIKKCAFTNLYWIKPNHKQITGGDSDEFDLRDILSLSAYIFNDKNLKYVAYDKLDFGSIWGLGQDACIEYEKIKGKVFEKNNIFLKSSGNFILRSGYEKQDSFLNFRCGPLGGGHGHFDKLHINLSIKGEDVLIDSGRYTYVDCEKRHYFKSVKAHNVPIVDNLDYTKQLDSWATADVTRIVNQDFIERDNYVYIEAGHIGYISKGVYTNRRVLKIKSDIYIVIDEFYTGGKHNYQQLYHFNSLGDVTLEKDKVSYSGENIIADFYKIDESVEFEISNCKISRFYNDEEDSKKLALKKNDNEFSSIVTVIIGQSKNDYKEYKVEKFPVISAMKKEKIDEKMALGIRIKGEKEDYAIVINHLESANNLDYIGFEDISAIGTVMICDMTKEEKKMEVIKY